MRLAQTQVWPALRYFEIIAPSTAASISASSNTMKGALPPSSSEIRLMVGAHCAIKRRPTSVEPVKDSLRTISLLVSSAPISRALPVTICRTPAGIPAFSANTPRARAVSGVRSAGRTIIVQPAARAGAALRVIIAAGKFHGVIAAVTPTGWRITVRRCPFCGAGIVSP